jgi:hypothetical protein
MNFLTLVECRKKPWELLAPAQRRVPRRFRQMSEHSVGYGGSDTASARWNIKGVLNTSRQRSGERNRTRDERAVANHFERSLLIKRLIWSGPSDVEGLSHLVESKIMSTNQRKIYVSENGDRWWLCEEVLHEANLSSGGKSTKIEIGDFLGTGKTGPEHQSLLRLIGELATVA